jgi:peptidoglycan-associated lipoprotein
MRRPLICLTIISATLTFAACGPKKPATPNAPASTTTVAPFPNAGGSSAPTTPPAPTPQPTSTRLPNDPPIVSKPLGLNDKPIEELNGPDSPLRPVFFRYDSDDLDDAARQVLTMDVQILKTYPSWVVTLEGHCDERGTAEYNVALGDRRALAVKTYLQSLGIAADRLRTVSYGKEFPFSPGHEETDWANNRRAQLVLTAK